MRYDTQMPCLNVKKVLRLPQNVFYGNISAQNIEIKSLFRCIANLFTVIKLLIIAFCRAFHQFGHKF